MMWALALLTLSNVLIVNILQNNTLGLKIELCKQNQAAGSVTRKKSPNVYKSWPKMISLEK